MAVKSSTKGSTPNVARAIRGGDAARNRAHARVAKLTAKSPGAALNRAVRDGLRGRG